MGFEIRMTRAVACAAALMMCAASASADPAGFAFLEVPAGARASALGGAYGTMAEGVDAAFWNPAGLAAGRGIQLTASHYEFLEGLRHAQFGIAGRWLGGGMAATLRAMYSEPITERDALGNPTGTFGSHDIELGLAYGRMLLPGWKVGGSAQLVRERIADFAATTWALGAGATWEPAAWPGLRAGLSLHNLGPAGHFSFDGVSGEDVPLPAAVQAGASYGFDTNGLGVRGAIETRVTRGRAGIGMLGAELTHGVGAALRAGLRVNDETTGLSVGAGYASSVLHFDYAYVPYQLELGDTHRISLSAQF